MKKIFIIIIGICLIEVIMFSEVMSINSENNSIKVIGHRGAAGLAPENTLHSIQKALELNVDVIEIDVHCTSDGEIVIMHDSKVNRTTNGEGKVRDLCLSDIKALNIVDSNGNETNFKVPTLLEAIKLIDGKADLLIEIKHGSDYYPEIEKKVLAIINNNDALEWCIIQSFEDEVLEYANKIEPRIRLYKLFYGNIFGIGIKRKKLSKYAYVSAFNPFYLGISKRFVKKVKAMDKEVYVWTVDSEKAVNRAIEKDVDGIITNRPDILKKRMSNFRFQ